MDKEPLVRVVRGEPAPEELAALVSVLAARSVIINSQPPRQTSSAWTASARPSIRPASWRASALPR